MIIKNITIQNFRSYYGKTSFDIHDGLTLIIGSNGDGKTTFFEALEWLFCTTEKRIDEKYISRKRVKELSPGEVDKLIVSMTFEHYGENRLEKSFDFQKCLDGEIELLNYDFTLYEQDGVQRRPISGEYIDRYFDAYVRQYCLFKGERELNIFNKPETLNNLVDTFSDIRTFDPYVSFAKYAQTQSEQATDNALKLDSKNKRRTAELKSVISDLRSQIESKTQEMNTLRNEALTFSQLLEELERNHEASSILIDINDRITNEENKRREALFKIKEDYTIRLLDEMWILLGFAPIAKEYSEKIAIANKEKIKAQRKYDKEMGAMQQVDQIKRQLQDGIVPLAPYIPDERTMREMLDDHICKVCNTPAPEGSSQYEFMKQRLEEYLKYISPEEDEETPELFPYEYVQELHKRDIILNTHFDFLNKIRRVIMDDIEFNDKNKKEVEKREQIIGELQENKNKLLAQTQGLDESDLINAFHNITNWNASKAEAERTADRLESTIKILQSRLEIEESQYNEIASKSSTAALYSRISIALKKIADAFASAKIRNKKEFIGILEAKANLYLSLLNTDDFKGVIKLIERADKSVMIQMSDSNGDIIYNPNTALETTMYMSVLFAVAELTSSKRDNAYPLIFDAPTSSFTDAKESDFFKVIGDIKKQTIIVTKSFLTTANDGSVVLDNDMIKKIPGRVYQISKKRPFDDKDLSTIQTSAVLIKTE